MQKHSTTTPNIKGAARTDILSLASGLRCKVGDLAIVGGGITFEENLGCIVEVISVAYIHDRLGFCWNIRSVGRALKLLTPKDRTVYFDTDGIAPDCTLTPIKGVPTDEAEDEDVGHEFELTAEVH